MDVVELPLPAAITVSKLMGTGGLSGGGVGVTVEEVDAACESERFLATPSIDSCTSLLSKKDEICAINASKTPFWNERPGVELHRRADQSSNMRGEDVPKDLSFGNTNSSLSVMLKTEGKQSQRKSGKVARSSGGSSKRLRLTQVEVSLNGPVTNDMKEKTQVAKQTNNLDAKRGDRRHGKVPKSKYDSFSLKNGLLSIGSAAGGNINLGAYGSNPDNFDITKHVDELLLNELLDGSCKCPSLAKGKMKEAANSNETILNSVRRACSVLRFQKPVQPQNITEVDNGYEEKVLTCPASSASCLADKIDGDKGDTCSAGLSLCNKDSSSKCIPLTDVLDFPLHQPKDILERLALTTSKDLDSLLLDSTKTTPRSSSDLRSAKPVPHRAGLPPFPWSHTSSGHLKSNSDAVKLSTSRSMCQGRWVKIGNTLTSRDATCGVIVDLESLAYDHSLVPSGLLKSGFSENGNVPPSAANITTYEQGLPSSATSSTSQFPPAMVEHCPSLLAAARTLYEIASLPLKKIPHGTIQWLKNPSQRAMKACKLMSSEKSGKIFSVSKSAPKPDNLIRYADEMLPSKKPRLSIDEKSGDLCSINTTRKALINWSTAQPNKPSPSRSSKDSVAVTKNNSSHYLKRPYMAPPSRRVMDKSCNRQQKLQKSVPMEWSRADYKLD